MVLLWLNDDNISRNTKRNPGQSFGISFIFLVIFLATGLQNLYPSNQIEISLLTCSSGKESYTTWGHSALRVIDKKNSLDVVYNFGLFDFNTPNFNLKFIQGKLKYYLGIQSKIDFYDTYKAENRQIIEQKLNLADEDEAKIISRLSFLYQPEIDFIFMILQRKTARPN